MKCEIIHDFVILNIYTKLNQSQSINESIRVRTRFFLNSTTTLTLALKR